MPTSIDKLKNSLTIEEIKFKIDFIKNDILADLDVSDRKEFRNKFHYKYGEYDKWTDQNLEIYLEDIFFHGIQTNQMGDYRDYREIDVEDLLSEIQEVWRYRVRDWC